MESNVKSKYDDPSSVSAQDVGAGVESASFDLGSTAEARSDRMSRKSSEDASLRREEEVQQELTALRRQCEANAQSSSRPSAAARPDGVGVRAMNQRVSSQRVRMQTHPINSLAASPVSQHSSAGISPPSPPTSPPSIDDVRRPRYRYVTFCKSVITCALVCIAASILSLAAHRDSLSQPTRNHRLLQVGESIVELRYTLRDDPSAPTSLSVSPSIAEV